MKKIIITLIIGILLISLVSAFNYRENYCNRYSTDKECTCKEDEIKVSVWKTPYCPPDRLCILAFRFAYTYCKREGKEIDERIAENIYNALNKIKRYEK